jgi:amino acid efflux transporter
VRAGFGARASAVTGAWFLAAVVIGAPAVSLIGGFYVADLTGAGTAVAASVGLAMFAAVLAANAFGLRVSSGLQLGLSAVLVAVVAVAIASVVPAHGGEHWTPFAPHGWWAVGSAANVLMWLFVGWEAVAQLAGDLRDLPRSMRLAFVVVTVLYLGLAVATIVVGAPRSRVPLADLLAVGFGRAGRDATAVLAIALTMGTMNVYLGGAAKLAAALAGEGALPAWFAGDARRSVPRRPLAVLALVGGALLVALAAGLGSTDGLVRATSACFVAVYLLALSAAVRILRGRERAAAIVALAAMVVVAAFSAAYALVPACVGLASFALYSKTSTRNPCVMPTRS